MERLTYQDFKKQLNIESIASFAADQLREEDSVTDEPIDEDWIARFFRIAEDISTEEMQALWGKILAGEIKRPSSFSLRALEIVKNLSKSEAEIFTRLANYAISSQNTAFYFRVDELYPGTLINLNHGEITLMVEVGLLQASELLNWIVAQSPTDVKHAFKFGDHLVHLDKKANSPEIEIPVFKFTTAGSQLLRLVNVDPPLVYLNSFARFIQSYGSSPSYSKITSIAENGIISYQLPLVNFPLNNKL